MAFAMAVSDGFPFAVDVGHGSGDAYRIGKYLMRRPRDQRVVYAYRSDPLGQTASRLGRESIVPRLQGLTTVTCAMLGGPEQHITSRY